MSISTLISRLALSTSALASASAMASPSCSIVSCDTGDTYAIQIGQSGEDCDFELHRCTSSRVSPPEVRLECHLDAGSYYCEAWPQGDNLGYAWIATGGLMLPDPTAATSPHQIVTCVAGQDGDHVLAVEVVSPFGLAASAQISLSCP
ncbi:MAG: hypothetical protein KF823_01445 [Xanthomonadales bacterium]|nr:hypothetical protein [Xanthomonadales bacterium]